MKWCKHQSGTAQARQQPLSRALPQDTPGYPGSPSCLVLRKKGFQGLQTAPQMPASWCMVVLIHVRNLVTCV